MAFGELSGALLTGDTEPDKGKDLFNLGGEKTPSMPVRAGDANPLLGDAARFNLGLGKKAIGPAANADEQMMEGVIRSMLEGQF